jgi:hypothetical protein
MKYKNNLPIVQKFSKTYRAPKSGKKFTEVYVIEPGEVKEFDDNLDEMIHIVRDNVIIGGECPNLTCLDHPERKVHHALDYSLVVMKKIEEEVEVLKAQSEMLKRAAKAAEEKSKLEKEIEALNKKGK